MPTSLMLPPSVGSLDAFFETEGKTNPQNEIRPQKLGLDGIIDNLLKFNADSIGNELVVDRLNVVIDRLDSILEKNSFGGLFGGFGRSMARTNGENALLPKINLKFLTESFTQISTSFKEVFAGYTKSITSSFNNIRNALNPEKLVEFLAVPIKSLMKPISESIMNLKKDVSNVFEGVGDIIAAPFRMIGNVTSFLFNKDKGYPFERLEKDIDLTNRILTAIEKSIREVLIKELQFNILERVINIDERLRASEIKTESNELQQMENVSEAARLEDQRADKQNDLLASIAEKLDTLGVKESKKIQQQKEAAATSPLDKIADIGKQFLKRAALPALGVGLGLSTMGDATENYQNRIKGEDTFTDYLGTIGKGAASGAAIGSWFGPMGALVGGAVGAGVSGAASAITALTPSQKEAEEKRAKAWEDQQNEAALKSLEEQGKLDRNLFGESKIDESKLEQMSTRELTALSSLNDFSESDTQKIQSALEKRIELDRKLEEESKRKTEETKTEARAQYEGKTSAEQIVKLEQERDKIVEQLRTVKASESQIQQVTKDFDAQITNLKTTEATIQAPSDVSTISQMDVMKGTVDSMAMKTAAEVGSAVAPIISSNSSSNASSIVVNAPATTINSPRGNTFQGVKSTISMNN